MKRQSLVFTCSILCLLCLCWAWVHFSQSKSDTTSFALPSYALVSIDDARKPWLADIEAHRNDVQALFESRQRIPAIQRYQLFSGDHPYTDADYRKEDLAYHSERIVGNYHQTTSDQGAVRDQGTAFLTEFSRHCSRNLTISVDELVKLGKSARDAGSTSVLVRFAQVSLSNQPDKEKLAEFETLESEMQSAKIHPFHRARLALWVHHLTKRLSPGTQDVNRRFHEAIARYVEYCEAESPTANPRLIWLQFDGFYSSLSVEEKRHMLGALWENGKGDPWLVHLTAGIYFKDLAFQKRGTRFASAVTESQWAETEDASKMADEHLLRAWQLAPDRPEAPTVLISLNMMSGTRLGTGSDWFYEAVRGQADWMNAYHKYWYAIQPRWGGSHAMMLRFADQCIETGRYDTPVPLVTIDILKHIESDLGTLDDLVHVPQVPEISKKFGERLEAAVDKGTPCPANHENTWGYLVRLRVLTGDFVGARKIYETYGKGRVGLSALGVNGLKSSYIRGLTYASTGPAKEDVSAFETFLNQPLEEGSEIEVLDEIQEVLKGARELDDQPGSQSYYHDIETIEKHLRAFHTDQWVEFALDAELSGLYAEASQVKILPGGELQMTSFQDRPGIQLRPMARFRPPFVCEVELTMGSDGQRASHPAGLIYGSPMHSSIYAKQLMRSMYLSHTGELVNLVDAMNPEKHRQTYWNLHSLPFHQLRMVVLDRRLEFQADRECISFIPLPEGAITDGFTVGELLPASQASSFRIRHMRIKRLPFHDYPEDSAPLADQLHYFQQMQDIDPLSSTAWYRLGLTYMLQGDYLKAVEAFDKYSALNPAQRLSRSQYAEGLLQVNRWHDAKKEFLAILDSDAESVDANCALGWMYATAAEDDFRNGAEALKYAQRACEIASHKQIQYWRPHLMMAVSQYELGQLTEAQQQIDLSVELAPDSVKAYLRNIQTEMAAHRALRYPSTPAKGDQSPKP